MGEAEHPSFLDVSTTLDVPMIPKINLIYLCKHKDSNSSNSKLFGELSIFRKSFFENDGTGTFLKIRLEYGINIFQNARKDIFEYLEQGINIFQKKTETAICVFAAKH